MNKEIKIVGVVGAGIMGSGIAQVCATAGFKVWLYDISQGQLKKALANIEKFLTKGGRIKAMQNLNITSELNNLKEADFCIEAATENIELKKKIFKELDAIAPIGTILASNTSSIPISELAKATRRSAQVIGMHFMNPVPLMECVEVICGKETSAETLQTTLTLAKKLGKTPVTVKDAPGFVVNRILLPMLNEAIHCLEEGLATKEDIDLAMKLSCNFPMGPLTLADFVGLDTCLFILGVMNKKPSPLLKKMVEEGKLGRKSGEGFYRYDGTIVR